MSARARRPTDDAGTDVYSSEQQRALLGAAIPTPLSAERALESFEDPTEVNPQVAAGEPALPTGPEADQATPVDVAAGVDRSEPFQVISMKEHLELLEPPEPKAPLHVQLRSMGEAARRRDTPPAGLGHLAPPRELQRPRRHLLTRARLIAIAVIVVGGVALARWLLTRS